MKRMDTARRKSVSSNDRLSADNLSAISSTENYLEKKEADTEMQNGSNIETTARPDYTVAFSPGHLEKLKGIFNTFDTNGSGFLSMEEFSKLMAKLAEMHGHEVEVSFEGFCNIVKAGRKSPLPVQNPSSTSL